MNDINNNLGLWTKERQDAVLRLWREIAAAFNGDPVLYGYDLVNEPIDKVYDVRSMRWIGIVSLKNWHGKSVPSIRLRRSSWRLPTIRVP